MTEKSTTRRNAILLATMVGSCLVGGFVGWKTGRAYQSSLLLDQADGRHSPYLSRSVRLFMSLRDVVGLSRYRSELRQDKWIAEFAFPDVEDGYFVDVGSGDGVRYSNTKALEDLGWSGVCVDPFPTNMEGRTCRLFRDVVYSEGGRTETFLDAGVRGGIDRHLGRGRKWIGTETRAVELKTTTLGDILAEAEAPGFIHYMSLDIEGAELEALRGFPFSRYSVGAFTIEHNHEEPKRRRIRELLESEGYRFVLTLGVDDCYMMPGRLE